MTLQCRNLISCVRIPQLAGAVVASSDEAVTSLVEGTVGQGQHVRAQDLHACRPCTQQAVTIDIDASLTGLLPLVASQCR
jgi:hypothetical protein